MKRLLSCLGLAALAPSLALAYGIDVTWNACGTDGVQNRNFACTGDLDENYSMYFQIKPHQDLPDFVAVECYAQLMAGGPIGTNSNPSTYPHAFWQYQPNGCAGGPDRGVRVFDRIPASCSNSGYVDFAGGDGSVAVEDFAYREDWDGNFVHPGVGYFLATDVRDLDNPQPLTADVNYWALELRFNNHHRASCAGCNEPIVLIFNRAILRGTSGTSVEEAFADKASTCAAFNGGSPSTCDAVPARNTTWGRIKSLYR